MSRTPTLADRLSGALEIGQHPLTLSHRHVAEGDGIATETLTFLTASGEPVRGLLTRPRAAGRYPAILYTHAHGGNYGLGADELIKGRKALLGPLGPVLARSGYVTLCIDLPCFGTRSGQAESAAAKAALWHGRSLAGQMVGELASALDHLAGRAEVDATRIGAFGISMGATFSYWLAAVERRIACVAHLCCYADFATLIALDAHDGHGIYLTVPGLLDIASNGEIAGLVAPRPQLIAVGGTDPLTPPEAVQAALAQTRAAYRQHGAEDALTLMDSPDTGHVETSAMRAAMRDFFARNLGPARRRA